MRPAFLSLFAILLPGSVPCVSVLGVSVFGENLSDTRRKDSTVQLVQFKTTKAVSGSVVDSQTGQPITGVIVVAETGQRKPSKAVSIKTNKQGMFQFDALPEGTIGIRFVKRGFVSEERKQPIGTKPMQIALQPVVKHRLRIRTSEGGFVPSLRIRLGRKAAGATDISWQREGYQVSKHYDAKLGAFTARVDLYPIGETFFEFHSVGFVDAIVKLPGYENGPQVIPVTMRPAPTASGVVVNAETGEPIPGAILAIVNRREWLATDFYATLRPLSEQFRIFRGVKQVADRSGRFKLPLPPDWNGNSLIVAIPGLGFHIISEADSILSEASPVLSVPTSGSIAGRLAYGQSEPAVQSGASGQMMRVQWKWPVGNVHSTNGFRFGGHVTTDSDGRFRFDYLGPGEYQFQHLKHVKGADFNQAFIIGQADVVVRSGMTVTRDLIHPAGVMIQGKVMNRKGEPYPDCLTVLRRIGEPAAFKAIDAANSDQQGRFRLGPASPGQRYIITAQSFLKASGRLLIENAVKSTAVQNIVAKESLDITITLD